MANISPSSAVYAAPVTCSRSESISVVDTVSPVRSQLRSILVPKHTRTRSTSSQKQVRIAENPVCIFIHNSTNETNSDDESHKFVTDLIDYTKKCVNAKTKREIEEYKKTFDVLQGKVVKILYKSPKLQQEMIKVVSRNILVNMTKNTNDKMEDALEQMASELLQIQECNTQMQLTDIPVKASCGCHCVIM